MNRDTSRHATPGYLSNWSNRIARRLSGETRRSIRLLWSMSQQHRRYLLLAFACNLAAALFEGSSMGILTVALAALAGEVSDFSSSLGTLGPLVQNLSSNLGQGGLFLLLVAAAVVSQVLRSGLQFGGRTATAYLLTRVQAEAKRLTFRQFMEMSYAQISRYSMGDLQTYMSQTNAVGNSIDQINTVVQTILTTIVYLVVLLWLSWPMTLAALAALALLSFMLRGIISHVRVMARRLNDLSKSMNIGVAQFLQGLRLLRTFAREEFAIGKMDELITDSEIATRMGHIWGISLGPIMESITVIGIALFMVGGYLFLGTKSGDALPRLVAFVVVMSRLIPRVMSINNAFVSLNNYWPAIERVSNILASEDKEYIRDGGRPFDGLRQGIEFRHVSLRYVESETPAVIDLSFSIPRGSMVALVGESGAGKSTTVDLLLRLYDPSSGQILVDGVELPELDLKAWRSHLSTVSQDPFVFNDSVRANIAFGKLEATDEEVVAAAQAANAHDFILQLTEGYDTVIGDRGYRLSGGQRQRITLARAILRNPDILILDEATSDLDSQSERLIQEALDGLRKECTVVAVAHRLSTINMADQILVLSKGRLVERGTHDELITLEGQYAHFWRIQSNVPNDVHV